MLPKKLYNIIYADCPWDFKTYSDKGAGRSPSRHYPCMSLEEIKALPNYPKQSNEHHALEDAKWTYELYKFLNKI